MNDGVQYVKNLGFFEVRGMQIVGIGGAGVAHNQLPLPSLKRRNFWLPSLTSKPWHLYRGRYGDKDQIAIALRPMADRGVPVDQWDAKPIASGKWSETWPLFLTYVNLMQGNE